MGPGGLVHIMRRSLRSSFLTAVAVAPIEQMFLTELLPGPFKYQCVILCQIVTSWAENRARAIPTCLLLFLVGILLLLVQLWLFLCMFSLPDCCQEHSEVGCLMVASCSPRVKCWNQTLEHNKMKGWRNDMKVNQWFSQLSSSLSLFPLHHTTLQLLFIWPNWITKIETTGFQLSAEVLCLCWPLDHRASVFWRQILVGRIDKTQHRSQQ